MYGSMRPGINGTEAFLMSQRVIKVDFKELIAALCLYKHKEGLNEHNCIGYKITNEEIVLLFKSG